MITEEFHFMAWSTNTQQAHNRFCRQSLIHVSSRLLMSFSILVVTHSVATDYRKQFQCLYIVLNNKPGPLFLEFNLCEGKL